VPSLLLTIDEINVSKTARHNLLLKLEILRIDLSLRESFCNYGLIESLGFLSRIDPKHTEIRYAIREVR
jgi:hypothetical protein